MIIIKKKFRLRTQRTPFNLIEEINKNIEFRKEPGEEINKNIEFRKEPGGHYHYTSSAWNEKSY